MSHQRRKEHRPAEILAAALDVFTDNGFAATRMSDIAARAGVSRPTLYLYFTNKEAIFVALVREHVGPMVAEAGAQLDSFEGSAKDLLSQVLRRFFSHVTRPAVTRILRLVIAEGPQFPELTDLYFSEVIEPGRSILGRVLKNGADRGEFRTSAASLDARLLVAPALMAVIWNATFSKQEPLDLQSLVDDHIAVVLTGIAAGEEA